MKLDIAQAMAEQVKQRLAPYCHRIEIAGSIRRQKPDVKDIELVCIRKGATIREFIDEVNRWPKLKGDPLGKYTQRMVTIGDHTINLDLFMCRPDTWGLIFAVRTGSAEFSRIKLASRWVELGYKSDGGVLYRDGKPTYVREERELFELLKITYVEPQGREL